MATINRPDPIGPVMRLFSNIEQMCLLVHHTV